MIKFEQVQYILDSVGKEIAITSLEFVGNDKTYSVLTAINRLGYLHWPPNNTVEHGQAEADICTNDCSMCYFSGECNESGKNTRAADHRH